MLCGPLQSDLSSHLGVMLMATTNRPAVLLRRISGTHCARSSEPEQATEESSASKPEPKCLTPVEDGDCDLNIFRLATEAGVPAFTKRKDRDG
jgi:hypothetical protein